MTGDFIPAAKMNGLGNEILILDMRGQSRPLAPDFVRLLAQQPQTAFDQIMALYPQIPAEAGAERQNRPYKVEIWNRDGTKAKACGNGTRCLAAYLTRQEERQEAVSAAGANRETNKQADLSDGGEAAGINGAEKQGVESVVSATGKEGNAAGRSAVDAAIGGDNAAGGAPESKNSGRIYNFATDGGAVQAIMQANGLIAVDMGKPKFAPADIPLAFVPENNDKRREGAQPRQGKETMRRGGTQSRLGEEIMRRGGAQLRQGEEIMRRGGAQLRQGIDMNHVPLEALLPDTLPAGLDLSLFPQTASVLSIGNPHCVFFLPPNAEKPLADYDLAQFGAALEHSPAFSQGVNVSLAQIRTPDKINLRVWERGAGLTLACGTAACAAVIAAHRRGLCAAEAKVSLPGGALNIALRRGHCLMSGPAEFEYSGAICARTGAFRPSAADCR